MAKLENYNGSVSLMAGITQKGGGDFALIEANAIQTREDGTRLDAELEQLKALVGGESASEQINTKVSFTEAQDLTDEQQAQARENIGAASFESITATIQVPININDEVYDNAHFSTDGNSLWDVGLGYGLMSKNYLPVIGGKTIEALYGNNSFNADIRINQYNQNKTKIGSIQSLRPKISKGLPTSDTSVPKQLTLYEDTAFIKFCVTHWNQNVVIEDTQITIAYVEDTVVDYVDCSVMKEQTFIKIPNTFDTIDVMRGCVGLKVGDYCKTNGYYAFKDGGGADYIIASEINEAEHQEEICNGLYAVLVHNGDVNVKQLGAYGDGKHDDTAAFQKAFELATNSVYIPKGLYIITSTVAISDKEYFTINAENSTIQYQGTSGYCFEVSNIWHSTFNFGEILTKQATADGCVDFYSNGGTAGYIDVYFKHFSSYKNCVYIHSDTGYINELRFYNGRVSTIEWNNTGLTGVGFKIEAQDSNVIMDGYRLQRIGFEAVDIGLYLIGHKDGQGVLGGVNNVNAYDCRCESTNRVLKTENNVEHVFLRNIGTQFNPSLFDLSEGTTCSRIIELITDAVNGRYVAHEAVIWNGIIIPNVIGRSMEANGVIDLTQENDIVSAYTLFYISEYCPSLKLSRVYGTLGEHGLNKFTIKMLGKNVDGFVIYDAYDNIICDGSNINVGDIIEFEYLSLQIGHSENTWIATKLNTIDMPTLPILSTDDNNKILTVANGSPVWSTLDAPSTSEFEQLKALVGDTAVSDQISNAVSQKSQVQIITWEADD